MISSFRFEDGSKKEWEAAYVKTDTLFEEMYINDGNNSEGLRYREGQHDMALDIMEAIRDKKMLFVEAGVGIGKSYAYLVPVISSIESMQKCNKIVVSTSTIALQNQLMNDIDKVQEMLGTDIKVYVCKGANNFACYNKVNEAIIQRSCNTKSSQLRQLKKVRELIEQSDFSDIDKQSFDFIDEQLWKAIQITDPNRCEKCDYFRTCSFPASQDNLNKAQLIVTNHGKLITSIASDESWTSGIDGIIFDEAHKIPEIVDGLYQNKIVINEMLSKLERISYVYGCGNEESFNSMCGEYRKNLETLFIRLREVAYVNFYNNNVNDNISITNCDTISLFIDKEMASVKSKIEHSIEKVISDWNSVVKKINYFNNDPRTGEVPDYVSDYLSNCVRVFKDLKKGENSENLFSVHFFRDDRIDILYTPKNKVKITKKVFSRDIPRVFTSGTLGEVAAFTKRLKISEKDPSISSSKLSPFNYWDNTLAYYCPSISSYHDHDNYIEDLTVKIDELIQITEGKALVLFTAKSDMKEVFDRLKGNEYNFNLLLQDEHNTSEVQKQFDEDTNSVLFATGAFWEGIDIKGSSLSNLIITRLPFPISNPVLEYNYSLYPDKKLAFQELYLNEMLVKFAQGAGRLIRKSDDVGIICSLDPRTERYLENLQRVSPAFCNPTTDIDEVRNFSEQKITKNGEGQVLKKARVS